MTIGVEILLVLLVSTLNGAFIFASYQFGVYQGKQIQAALEDKDVVKINKGNQKVARGYKEFTEYQG